MAEQLLQRLGVFLRRVTNEVARGSLLSGLVETALDDGLNRSRSLRIIDVGLGETVIDIGHDFAERSLAAQDLDVASGQPASPLHRRGDMSCLVGPRPLPGDELKAKGLPLLQ